MSKLAGKNILITSASQGLGREMALRFARESAAGLSLVARQADRLNAVRDEIRKIASKFRDPDGYEVTIAFESSTPVGPTPAK
jgi:short-subunit dehydrogenase